MRGGAPVGSSWYGLEPDLTDRALADRACLAVLDLVRSRCVTASVDAYSDYQEELPAPARAAQDELRARGASRRRGDPGMAVELDPADPQDWALLRAFAAWSIHVELDSAGGTLAVLHDCGRSISAELSPAEADGLGRALGGEVRVAALGTRRRGRPVLGRLGRRTLPPQVFTATLRSELGEPRRLRPISSSPRSRVWRARLAGRPVVIKQIVANADIDDDADQRFSRELAGLRLAARVDPPVVPALLGADPDARVLVLQRLTGRQLSQGWQLDYAAALARFHAAGRHVEPGTLPAWPGPEAEDVTAFLALAEWLGIAVPEALAADLQAVVGRSEQSNARCLLHGDPCPDNLVATPLGIRFFDLEQVALGDGLVELAYLRMGFPTCWCVTSVAAPVLRAAEQAYRDTWLAETGEPARGDLTEACIGWLLRGDALVARAERGTVDQLGRLADADWRWGTVTARERLAYRLGAVAELIGDDGAHAEFGRLAGAMHDAMLRRWPALRRPPARATIRQV